MPSLFSHIVRRRMSDAAEDVATDALAYVLESSDAARQGMMKLIRGIHPDAPSLRFRTQQVDGDMRPDMCGMAGAELRVLVENKFWAGLTDNQPVSYLQRLAEFPHPTLLLVVAPEAREHTLWRELTRRIRDEGLWFEEGTPSAGVARTAAVAKGPVLALTSWGKLLSMLEREAADDRNAVADLLQLRALCDAADGAAFLPMSSSQIGDQRTPRLILQLTSVVQAVVSKSEVDGSISLTGLRQSNQGGRLGRYVQIPSNQPAAGAFLGVHFGLWSKQGETPIWLVFTDTPWGRAAEVRSLVEPWAADVGVSTASDEDGFSVGLAIPVGEEKDEVVRSIVETLRKIGEVLKHLPPGAAPTEPQEESAEEVQ